MIMMLHKGEMLFRQGELGPLCHLTSGLLKIVRVDEEGTPIIMNIILPNEIFPHHSLISHNPYHGTAVALMTCEFEMIDTKQWYLELERNPDKCRSIALLLQEKLRMMQQRIDQLTQISPADKLKKLQEWFHAYIAPSALTDVLTQTEIGQFIGLSRETVNRLLKAQSKLPAGPKNS
jgi:CRP/FNR family cyclic AMP-dependent transcriptional regulator